jgi:hypothetical protein
MRAILEEAQAAEAAREAVKLIEVGPGGSVPGQSVSKSST